LKIKDKANLCQAPVKSGGINDDLRGAAHYKYDRTKTEGWLLKNGK